MDKAQLFKPPADVQTEATVDLPTGGQVGVRALSREEQLKAIKQDDVTAEGMPKFERTAIIESRIVAAGMVDPEMTEAEVRRWQKVPGRGADVQAVSVRIQELSGMLEGSAKAAYKSDGRGPEPGVRALPGSEAGDDGGPAPVGDE